MKKVEGIGENAAVLLRLVPQLWSKARLSSVSHECILNSIESAGAYLLERLKSVQGEIVYQLCLDRKGKLLACKRLGEGSGVSVIVDVRKLLENQQDADPDEFVHNLKVDMFADEVFVFTPNGDVKSLPAGATPHRLCLLHPLRRGQPDGGGQGQWPDGPL